MAGCLKCDNNGAKQLKFRSQNVKNSTLSPIYQGLHHLEDIASDDEHDRERDDPEEDYDDQDEVELEEKNKTEQEILRLQSGLDRARSSISFMKERERKLRER